MHNPRKNKRMSCICQQVAAAQAVQAAAAQAEAERTRAVAVEETRREVAKVRRAPGARAVHSYFSSPPLFCTLRVSPSCAPPRFPLCAPSSCARALCACSPLSAPSRPSPCVCFCSIAVIPSLVCCSAPREQAERVRAAAVEETRRAAEVLREQTEMRATMQATAEAEARVRVEAQFKAEREAVAEARAAADAVRAPKHCMI